MMSKKATLCHILIALIEKKLDSHKLKEEILEELDETCEKIGLTGIHAEDFSVTRVFVHFEKAEPEDLEDDE